MGKKMMKVVDDQTVYVCMNIEASGPVPGFFNMVSIGGVAVRRIDGL